MAGGGAGMVACPFRFRGFKMINAAPPSDSSLSLQKYIKVSSWFDREMSVKITVFHSAVSRVERNMSKYYEDQQLVSSQADVADFDMALALS